MRHIIRNKNFYYMLLMDLVLLAACFYLSYFIRFEFSIPEDQLGAFFQVLPFVLALKILIFFYFNLYRGMWRYTSLEDMFNAAKAVFTSSLLIILGVLFIYHFQGFPRSVFIIDMFLTFLAVAGIRVAIRIYYSREMDVNFFSFVRRGMRGEKRLLIIGAGDAGEKVIREIRDNPELRYLPVGILDDNPGKMGKTIHGVQVLGSLKDMDRLRESFDEVLIAVAQRKGEEMRRIVDACKQSGKPYKTIPSIEELIDGRVSVKKMRDVTYTDLLGREEINLDHEGIKNYLTGKRILVTGAGGSIGSELVRQICPFQPEAVALLDVSELNLFNVEQECIHRFGQLDIKAYLVDIRHRDHLERVFREFQPQVVFHSAAYKHVPIQEVHPWEAVYNNILGTRNMVEAALERNMEHFVFVSTDKAVSPVNVMGATKRVAEMLVQSMDGEPGHCYMSVRFGNVIGSSGSAIPTFRSQIARGGPVTVTHPDITRYFMTIPESAQLILQAGALGTGGEIFVLDMGEPIRIQDMARDLIRLHGLEPDRDIKVLFTGLRPGEKLYEELITDDEGISTTEHEKILVLRAAPRDLEGLARQIEELLVVTRTYDADAIKRVLREIVSEYKPQF